MAIETLKEYLVKIGWNVDEISFKNADSVIDGVSGKLSKSASGIASSFIKAGTIVGEAIVEINEQMFSLIDKTASLDYQTEKLARQYWTTEKNTRSFSTALEAMGEDMNSIMYMTNEQYQRFIELNKLGRTLEAPKELDDYLVKVRGLNFEFNRLKVILQYASRWVVYWISKFTGNDIDTTTNKIRSFGDYLIKNIEPITQKVAKFFEFFYRMGKAGIAIIKGIGTAIIDVVDLFDNQTTRIIALVSLLGAVLLRSPITWFIGALMALLLLIDDYLVWKKGGKSAIDWSNFEQVISDLSSSFDELKANLKPVKDLLDQIFTKITGGMTVTQTLQKLIDGIASGLGLISSALSEISYWIDLISGKNKDENFLGQKSPIFDWIENNTGFFDNKAMGWLFGRGDYTGQENLFERIAGLFTSNPSDVGMVTYGGNTSNSKTFNQENNMTFNFSTNKDPNDVAETMKDALLRTRQWNPKVF